jgi:hypothetical protein
VLHANDQGQGSTYALYSNLCRTLGINPSEGRVVHGRERRDLRSLSRRSGLARCEHHHLSVLPWAAGSGCGSSVPMAFASVGRGKR